MFQREGALFIQTWNPPKILSPNHFDIFIPVPWVSGLGPSRTTVGWCKILVHYALQFNLKWNCIWLSQKWLFAHYKTELKTSTSLGYYYEWHSPVLNNLVLDWLRPFKCCVWLTHYVKKHKMIAHELIKPILICFTTGSLSACFVYYLHQSGTD